MNLGSQPRVSVITPVYNGATYLAECIESVLAQTYQNWDYVIVNNRSTDTTAEIVQMYAARDSRIRLHENQEFLPLVANHNQAMRQITPGSKYCKLIFADDWLFPECLERMVGVAEAHPSVGIVGAYGLFGSIVEWTGLPYPSTVTPGRDACRQRLLGGPYVFGTGTSHMIRSDLIRARDRVFNESSLHADSETCFQLLQSSDFGFVHQILSYTRPPRSESLTSTASRLRALEFATLYELIIYGPVFLTPEELKFRKAEKRKQYYEFLAHSFLEGGESWDFHKKKLGELGLGLNRSRLARAVFWKGLSALTANPKRTIRKLWNGTSVATSRLRTTRSQHAN
jgi:glycosyltransferase involved in cell wall biosynthesis